MKNNDLTVCKGDFSLGTACGKCQRCLEARSMQPASLEPVNGDLRGRIEALAASIALDDSGAASELRMIRLEVCRLEAREHALRAEVDRLTTFNKAYADTITGLNRAIKSEKEIVSTLSAQIEGLQSAAPRITGTTFDLAILDDLVPGPLVEQDQPSYTTVDMQNATRDGYKDGFATAIKSLPGQQRFTNWAVYLDWRREQIKAVGDAGGVL